MKLSKKVIIIIAAIVVFIIGGGVAYATNTPTARAERQLNLGNKYSQEGKYQEAILAFQKVIEIEPKNIPARLGLGQVYVVTMEFAKAEKALKEVIDIDPKNIPARVDLFKVYLKEGNLDAANAILQEINQIDPNNKEVKQFSSDLEATKAINASTVSYDQGIKQMNDKQYLLAVDSFQKVIKEDIERYADARTKSDECKKAFIEETLQKATDAASNKDYQRALDLLEQVLKIDSNNQEALKLKSDYLSVFQEMEKQKVSSSVNSKASNNENSKTINGTFPGIPFNIGTTQDTIIANLGQPKNIQEFEGSRRLYYDNYSFRINKLANNRMFWTDISSGEVLGIKINSTMLSDVDDILTKSPGSRWRLNDNTNIDNCYGYYPYDPIGIGFPRYDLTFDVDNNIIRCIHFDGILAPLKN